MDKLQKINWQKEQDFIYVELYNIFLLISKTFNNFCTIIPIKEYLKSFIRKLDHRIKEVYNIDLTQEISTSIKTYKKYDLAKEEINWYLIILSVIFSKYKDQISRVISFLALFLLAYKFHMSLLKKYLPKICKSEIIYAALEALPKTSLFNKNNNKVESFINTVLVPFINDETITEKIYMNSFVRGLAFITFSVFNKYITSISNINELNKIFLIIIHLRTRLVQSLQSLYEHYYQLINQLSRKQATEQLDEIKMINEIVDKHMQGILTIPANLIREIARRVQLSEDLINKLYYITFKNMSNYYLVKEIVIIIYKETDGKILKKEENKDFITWINQMKKVFMLRKNKLRDYIIQIIKSNVEIKNIYETKSISLQYKMIEAVGLIILAIFF